MSTPESVLVFLLRDPFCLHWPPVYTPELKLKICLEISMFPTHLGFLVFKTEVMRKHTLMTCYQNLQYVKII